MRRLGVIIFATLVLAALIASPVTVAKKTVNVQTIEQTLAAASAPVTISVPVVTVSNAIASECDPSEGKNPGLAWSCFLQWLMDVFDASSSPY